MSDPTSLTPADAVANAVNDGKKHLLLAASGSVATIKLPSILTALQKHGQNLSIRVVLTKSAAQFFNGQSAEQPSLASLMPHPAVDAVYQDEDEMVGSWTRGTGILHINLRKWAHVLVIAPLSANTLAKIVNGMSDSLLTSVVRAWDTSGLVDGVRRREIVVAPAMNAAMWMHPVTATQIRVLEDEWGVRGAGGGWFEVLRPMEKELACGDVGVGGMHDWTEIVKIIELRLGLAA